MNKFTTRCKFCQRPLVIVIDDCYPIERDPQRIIPLAACNRCADLRETQRRLEDSIGRVCMSFWSHKTNRKAGPDESVRMATEENLTHLTKKYADWFGEFKGLTGYLWDNALVESLMDKPERWGQVLGDYREAFGRLAKPPLPIEEPVESERILI